VTRAEWALIALAIGLVVAAELVNSAVERVADRAAPARTDPELGLLKDVSAAAVLVAAAAAVAVGLAIFLSRTVAALG
jgi:diacylglycerol kinase (ATP)